MNLMEQKRFKNQIDLPFIGEAGQLKLKNTKVVVIGAGGKGISVMKLLAAGGVGTIGICDNALVDEMELSRQNMYGLMDLGKQRAIVAKQYLEHMSHTNAFKVHNLLIDGNNNADFCMQYDLIVDATSNWKSKYEITKLVDGKDIPMVSGMTHNHAGEVFVNHKSDISKLQKYFKQKMEQPHIHTPVEDFAIPVILLSVTGSMIANEVFRVLLDIHSPVDGKKLVFSLDKYQFEIKDFKKSNTH